MRKIWSEVFSVSRADDVFRSRNAYNINGDISCRKLKLQHSCLSGSWTENLRTERRWESTGDVERIAWECELLFVVTRMNEAIKLYHLATTISLSSPHQWEYFIFSFILLFCQDFSCRSIHPVLKIMFIQVKAMSELPQNSCLRLIDMLVANIVSALHLPYFVF